MNCNRYYSKKFLGFEFSRIGKPDDVYMHRLTFGQVRLHVFWRSDADDPHDHPFSFTTFPIWPFLQIGMTAVWMARSSAGLSSRLFGVTQVMSENGAFSLA